MIFPRDINGKLEYNDIYIKCKKGKIYHYGRNILKCYIDKLGTGRNVLKALGKELGVDIEDYTDTKIKKDGSPYLDNNKNPIKFYDYDKFYEELEKTNIIFDIWETDEEVEFKFKNKDMEIIAKYMLPQTSGANIKPFSTKNLPKKKYDLSLNDLTEYKNIIKDIDKKDILIINRITKDFISKIPKKYKEFEGKDINAMKKQSCLKGKEFIHSLGLWKDYIKFLKKELNK